jgi:sulfotransferase family protein
MPKDDSASSRKRLVETPVFILSPMRSGSTLLRVVLNSHSMIRAPHELHLRTLEVHFTEFYTQLAVEKLGLDKSELEYLLWDRLLHYELTCSGKQIIVDKTPGNALIWRRLRECWPKARYIFLLRHPASVLTSMLECSRDLAGDLALKQRVRGHAQLAGTAALRPSELRPSEPRPRMDHPPGADEARERMTQLVLEHIHGVDEAMRELPGLTVRYEDLVGQPDQVTRSICAWLGVLWEPQMLDYGNYEHGGFEAFIGDFTAKIRSGTISAARPLPEADEVPELLREACTTWGYLS